MFKKIAGILQKGKKLFFFLFIIIITKMIFRRRSLLKLNLKDHMT